MSVDRLVDSRRGRWANFLARIVGKNRLVSVTDLDKALAQMKGRRSGADDRKSIYDQLHGKHAPSARNAWIIGETLHSICNVTWASGLLALFACDRLRHVLRALGSLIPMDLTPDVVERIASLVQTNVPATYVSPTDFGLVPVLPDERLEQQYFSIDEKRRRDRDAALTVWTLEPKLRALFQRSWERVLTRRGHLPFALAQGYRVAVQLGAPFRVRENAVRRHIMQWIYTEIHPEPPNYPEALMYEALVKAPNSNMAQFARVLLAYEYQSIRAEFAEVKWPDLEIPVGIQSRLDKIRKFAPEILDEEDPYEWLPLDEYDLRARQELED